LSPVSEKRCQGTEKNAELDSSWNIKITNFLLRQIILENKFQKNFVSVMNVLLIYLFTSMKLEKRHEKLLGSSFKIMLPLLYFKK
jgi:hypothetical protein